MLLYSLIPSYLLLCVIVQLGSVLLLTPETRVTVKTYNDCYVARIRLGWEESTVENVQQENTMTAMPCG